MSEALDALTEKEKDTLRLIVRGHDAKSAARELHLSVHTINERLRSARRKLDVTSSREAARLLFESEQAETPSSGNENSAHKPLGDAHSSTLNQNHTNHSRGQHAAYWIGGSVMFTALIAIIALAIPTLSGEKSATEADPTLVPCGATQEVDALEWLELADAGDMNASYAATARAYQALLSHSAYVESMNNTRGLLGEVIERRLTGVNVVQENGRTYHLVQFHTDFAQREGLVERVTLECEDGRYRTSGYWFI